jgi:hypothetical protein
MANDWTCASCGYVNGGWARWCICGALPPPSSTARVPTATTPVSPVPAPLPARPGLAWWYIVGRLVSVALLLVALDVHPYGYYRFLRLVVTAVAGYSAYLCMEWDRPRWFWVFVAITLLYNPIVPIHLSRGVWGPINLATAGVLIVSLFALRRPRRDPKSEQ